MSNLFRQTVGGQEGHIRTSPQTSNPPDLDDQSSNSSDSSASSSASVVTVRPSSHEVEAPPSHWTNYFDQELFLEKETDTHSATYHVYLTRPKAGGPLFICHHGAGASGLSFAVLAKEIQRILPDAGILSLEARNHGSVVKDKITSQPIVDFNLDILANDAVAMIRSVSSTLGYKSLPPSVLVGHSLGGAVMMNLINNKSHAAVLFPNFIGYCVIDVVEGSAIEALSHMKTYLSSRPSSFDSVEDAIHWHIRSRTIRDPRSAKASVPGLLINSPSSESDRFVWRTNLMATEPWWEQWYKGMSQKFLTGRGAKLLILAGTDRLDKDLMIGQMQGKFQLVVIPEAGHFVQEDVPEKTAGLLVEFFRRNDRSNLVLPPKVSDLIAQGKKV